MKQTMARIPLKTRLDRLARGYAGDPAYVCGAISAMADTPLCVYLGASSCEYDVMATFLHLTKEEETSITYGEAAARIFQMYRSPDELAVAKYAAEYLAGPLLKYYNEWSHAYGTNI